MDELRLKLTAQGLANVTFMVVNSQHKASRRLHHRLRLEMSDNITLYAQDPWQPDIWKALSGDTDDFLVYDKCGRLTSHISTPYSNLSAPYVENAIRETYCSSACGNCSSEDSEQIEACKKPEETEDVDKLMGDETVTLGPELGRLPWRHYDLDESSQIHGHKKHHVDGHGHGHGHGHSQHQDQTRHSGSRSHGEHPGHRLQLDRQDFQNIQPQLNQQLSLQEVLHLPVQRQQQP